MRDHHGCKGTNDVEGARQVDGDYLVKVLAIDLVTGAGADNAGAVNKGVDTVEYALDLFVASSQAVGEAMLHSTARIDDAG